MNRNPVFDRLEGKHIVLRKAKEDDALSMMENVWADEKVYRWMFFPPVFSEGEAMERCRRSVQYQKDNYAWFVALKDTDQAVGLCAIRENEPGRFEEAGICIGTAFQGKGYGREIVSLLLKLAFEKLGAEDVRYGYFRDNEKSRKLAESFGFAYDRSADMIRPWDGAAKKVDSCILTREKYFGLPELMRFADGTYVETPAQWAERRKEILALYEEHVYGKMPDKSGESVAFKIVPGSGNPVREMVVTVRAKGREACFPVRVTLPEKPAAGMACYIEYCPFSWFGKPFTSPNMQAAAARGYAAIQYDPVSVASDDDSHKGAYYDLYPDSCMQDRQDGVLLAWAWGACRILDALESGAGRELGIDPALCMIAGVSRYGKSAAVAGAYDERFRVTIPACSGAGGIALFRTDNHGKVYDLSSLGGPDAWVNESINEPFENLQGGEGYWFCPAFRKAAGAAALPVDQHMLCALAAGKDRHMMIVTGITSEGWNNTEGQCLAYVASQRVWDMLGAGAHNNMIIHLDGHAILPSDLEKILDYCDVHLTGKKKDSVPGSRSGMKGELFLEENREKLCSLFDRFEKEIDTVLSYRNE